MKTIEVNRKQVVLVSDEDFERVAGIRWFASPSGRRVYVQTRLNGKTTYIHRFIMNTAKGMDVDHIDGNGLNNQRSNLRVVSRSRNNMNSRGRKNLHGFPGVSKSNYTYFAARLYVEKKLIYLGIFKTAEEAAIAYRMAYLAATGEEHPFYRDRQVISDF